MKIILLSDNKETAYYIAHQLIKKNDDLIIAPVFTTDITMKDKVTENFIYYMDGQQVELSYKNNALMWVWSTKEVSIGVTLVDMYNSDIFIMDHKALNNMSEPCLSYITDQKDSVIVYIDQKLKRNNSEFIESKSAYDRICTKNYLYYYDNEVEKIIIDLLDYISSDILQKKEIIKENQG